MKLSINKDEQFRCIDLCPKCTQCKAKVVDSRWDTTLSIRLRTKECTNCGHRWGTAEILEDDLEVRDNMSCEKQLNIIKDAKYELQMTIIKMKEQSGILNDAIRKLNDIEKEKEKNGGL